MLKRTTKISLRFFSGLVAVGFLVMGYSNCSSNLASTDSADSASLASLQSAPMIFPQASLIHFNATLTLKSSGALGPLQFVLVSGLGSIDPTTGVYQAPSTETMAVVGLSDGATVLATANIKVQGIAPDLAIDPITMSLGVGDAASVTITGGVAPFTYAFSPTGIALADDTGKITAIGDGETTLTVTDAQGSVGSSTVVVAIHGKKVFRFSNSVQTFLVPKNVRVITVKAWGAGGGSGGTDYGNSGGRGGGGAFSTLSVPVQPAEKLTVIVGGGGTGGQSNLSLAPAGAGGFGGGANGGNGGLKGINGGGGGGGGLSGLVRVKLPLVVAGGGGGGGGGDPSAAGGPGGLDGTAALWGGALAGKAGASTSNAGVTGGSRLGGADGSGGGGGGGGADVFLDLTSGGGGGGGSAPLVDGGGGGGGGGSSIGIFQTGKGVTPGNATDKDRGGAGNGSPVSSGTGGNGIVIITW